MEIISSILIVASVVLPVLAVAAALVWAGLFVYSWIADLREEKVPEPAPEPVAATASTATTTAVEHAPAA